MPTAVLDWEAFLRAAVHSSLPEVNLAELKPGDRLSVFTAKTCYILEITASPQAELSTNRPDRPCGPVQLNGCTYGASATIKPDRLFCGGNLEFVVRSDRAHFTTTTILALQLVQATSNRELL